MNNRELIYQKTDCDESLGSVGKVPVAVRGDHEYNLTADLRVMGTITAQLTSIVP